MISGAQISETLENSVGYGRYLFGIKTGFPIVLGKEQLVQAHLFSQYRESQFISSACMCQAEGILSAPETRKICMSQKSGGATGMRVTNPTDSFAP